MPSRLTYRLDPAPRTGRRLFLRPAQPYAQLLPVLFTDSAWYGPYEAYDPGFDVVLYVQRPTDDLVAFLDMAQASLWLPSTLDECWALDFHWAGDRRTEIGELVRAAKTYDQDPGDLGAARQLGHRMAERFRVHPRVGVADRVTAVPANPPKHPYNLPDVLAKAIGGTGIPLDLDLVTKVRPTGQLKHLSDEAKVEAVSGAYQCLRHCRGERIVLVDDIFQSGTRLGAVGDVLQGAGAVTVIGLVATKTREGLSR